MIRPPFVRVAGVMLGILTLAVFALIFSHGVPGFGVSLLAAWASITLARWLKVRPTLLSAPEHVGLGRLSASLVLTWVVTNAFLAAVQPASAAGAQLSVLECLAVAYCAGFITLVFRRPKNSWRRKLNDVAAKLRSSFAKPVMGGASS